MVGHRLVSLLLGVAGVNVRVMFQMVSWGGVPGVGTGRYMGRCALCSEAALPQHLQHTHRLHHHHQLPESFLLGGRLQRAATFGSRQKGKVFRVSL